MANNVGDLIQLLETLPRFVTVKFDTAKTDTVRAHTTLRDISEVVLKTDEETKLLMAVLR